MVVVQQLAGLAQRGLPVFMTKKSLSLESLFYGVTDLTMLGIIFGTAFPVDTEE